MNPSAAAPSACHLPAGRPPRLAARERLRRFFLGAGLPCFLFSALAVYEAALGVILFGPAGAGGWGEFAQEFKVRCFNYDPRTGGMQWSAVGMMLLEPVFVAAVAAVLWRRALAAARGPGAWRPAVAGAVVAAGALGSVVALGWAAGAEELPPFPGERIRTRLPAPDFALRDQTGRPCSFADLRGRIVVVTGIYAQCATSCPPLLIELRRLLDALPPAVRARVSVVAFSLNPEYDTQELMAAVAAGYGFVHPEFRYLNGPPAAMHDLLDRWQFARSRDPRTGTIDHANLFQVIDPEGWIAYRFNLNPRHQAWLREALVGLAEPGPGREAP